MSDDTLPVWVCDVTVVVTMLALPVWVWLLLIWRRERPA